MVLRLETAPIGATIPTPDGEREEVIQPCAGPVPFAALHNPVSSGYYLYEKVWLQLVCFNTLWFFCYPECNEGSRNMDSFNTIWY